MALYELRTYTLYVGKMAEATRLYQELGFPALKKGGHDEKLVGYFQADTGTINQLVHLWKFDDDADRRKHCRGLRQQGLRGRFCLKVPTARHGTGGQAADRGAVGSTSVTGAASTYARRYCSRYTEVRRAVRSRNLGTPVR
jgi:NIPSNAP